VTASLILPQLDNFLTTSGFNFGGGYWGGGIITYTPGAGTAVGYGIFTSQIGGGGSFTLQPIKWKF